MPRFIADEHAGKLARWLRLIGCDTLHFNPIRDLDLTEVAARDGRVVLTRDTSFARRFPAVQVFRLESDDPFAQLQAVVWQYDLDTRGGRFTRCMLCNAPLQAIRKEEFRDVIPALAYERCTQFARCTGCGKFYWDGTHYKKMSERLDALKESWKAL